MRTGLDAETRKSVVVGLLVSAAAMLVFAAFWLFEAQINDALNTPGAWLKGGSGGIDDFALGLAGAFIILAANLLWLPGALIPPWVLVGVAAVCVLASAYIGFGG